MVGYRRRLTRTVSSIATLGIAAGCAATNRSNSAPPVGVAASTAPAAAMEAAMPGVPNVPYVRAATDVQAGEYLTIVGGCNDCHTERWAETNGNVPQQDRLTGNPVGYRGPWGTTYAANLRIVTQRIPEDRWVSILKTADGGDGKPPMPWMNTRMMSDQDLRALYRYIRALGPKGDRMPRYVPPGKAPTGPYVDMTTRSLSATPPSTNPPSATPQP